MRPPWKDLAEGAVATLVFLIAVAAIATGLRAAFDDRSELRRHDCADLCDARHARIASVGIYGCTCSDGTVHREED